MSASQPSLYGVTLTTSSWIEFSAPVHQIEGLLDTTYEMFSHTDSHVRVPRTTKYSVPEALHSVIDVVTPNTAFYSAMGAHLQETEPANLPQLERRAVEGGCLGGGIITPSCIKAVYNVDYTSKGSQLVATAGMLGIGANHSDYAIFGHNYVPGLEDFQDIGIGGGYNNGNGTKREGNLDTQYMGGVVTPTPASTSLLALPPEEPFTLTMPWPTLLAS